MAGCCCFIVVIRQNNIFNGVKMTLNNICNTVMSGQGPSSSGLRSVKKKPGRGIRLTSQSKHILTSVRSYFEEEKRTGKSLMKNRPLDRAATATGISKTTIKRIYQTMTEDKEIFTPTNDLYMWICLYIYSAFSSVGLP